jgi:hypothetical protein
MGGAGLVDRGAYRSGFTRSLRDAVGEVRMITIRFRVVRFAILGSVWDWYRQSTGQQCD